MSVESRSCEEFIGEISELLPKRFFTFSQGELVEFSYSLSEDQIRKIVLGVVRAHEALHAAIVSHRGLERDYSFVSDSAISPHDEDTLSKLLLYCDVIYCSDPILDHAFALQEMSSFSLNALYPFELERHQTDLYNGLNFYRVFSPAICDGIIYPSIFRTQYAFRNLVHSSFVVPGRSSEFSGVEETDELAELTKLLCEVKPARFKRGIIVEKPPETTPWNEVDQISISMKGDPDYAYVDTAKYMHPLEVDQDAPILTSANVPPQTIDMYDEWTKSAALTTTHNRIQSIRSDLTLCEALAVDFASTSSASIQILKRITGKSPNQNQAGAFAISGIDLPAVSSVPIKKIVKARKDIEAFNRFRNSFRVACSSIDVSRDEEEYRVAVNDRLKDMLRENQSTLREMVSGLKLVSGTILAVEAVKLTIGQLNSSLAGFDWYDAAVSSLSALPLIASTIVQRRSRRRNPGYFLWEMTKRPFKDGD